MTPTLDELRAAGVGEPAIALWLRAGPGDSRGSDDRTPSADARGTALAGVPRGVSVAENTRVAPRPSQAVKQAVERASPPLSEAEEQRRIRRDAIALGARVYWLSQARKTGQTAGLADLWIVWPGRLGLWWECKAVDGSRTAQQEQFGDECAGSGTAYGYGTHADWLAWCRDAVGVWPVPFTRGDVLALTPDEGPAA